MSRSLHYNEEKTIKMELEIKQEDVYHECGICSERFSTYSGLEIHSNIHCASPGTGTELNVNGETDLNTSPVQVSGTSVATQIIKEEPQEYTIEICENNTNVDVKQVRHHKETEEININSEKITNSVEARFKVLPLPKIIPNGKIDTNSLPKLNTGKGYTRAEIIGSLRKKMAPKATPEMLENPFRCGVCWQIFNEGKLLTEHVKSHEERRLKPSGIKCMFCYDMIADETEFQKHLMTHSGNLPYICNNCQMQFLSKAELDKHRRNQKHETFKCDFCSRTFSNIQNLKSHIPQHEQEGKLECNVCDKKFTRLGQLKVHVRLHIGDLPYKCRLCDKAFNSNNHLAIHIRSHTGEKPYKCDNCDECFTSMSRLQSHKKRVHEKLKAFSCDVCGKSFFLSYALLKHMTTHTGEKPFICSECPKSFARIEGLDLHMRTHSGEKPYKCNYCDKSFTVQSAVNAHIKWHTGEKNYKCDVCDATFIQSSQLWSHKRVHFGEKNNKCDVCGKSFVHVSSLKRHVMIHNEERPFNCDICKHGCKTRSDFNRHLKTHSEEKPYKCGICDKSFRNNSHIKRHIISVHKVASVERNIKSNKELEKSENETSSNSKKRSASPLGQTRRSSRRKFLKRSSMADYLYSEDEDDNDDGLHAKKCDDYVDDNAKTADNNVCTDVKINFADNNIVNGNSKISIAEGCGFDDAMTENNADGNDDTENDADDHGINDENDRDSEKIDFEIQINISDENS